MAASTPKRDFLISDLIKVTVSGSARVNIQKNAAILYAKAVNLRSILNQFDEITRSIVSKTAACFPIEGLELEVALFKGQPYIRLGRLAPASKVGERRYRMDLKLKCSEFLDLVEKCDEILESAKEMDDLRRVPTSADVAEVYNIGYDIYAELVLDKVAGLNEKNYGSAAYNALVDNELYDAANAQMSYDEFLPHVLKRCGPHPTVHPRILFFPRNTKEMSFCRGLTRSLLRPWAKRLI